MVEPPSDASRGGRRWETARELEPGEARGVKMSNLAYRYYFFEDRLTLAGHAVRDCEGDRHATRVAEGFLRRLRPSGAVEVWQDHRRVARREAAEAA
jgi:hypothetical protein